MKRRVEPEFDEATCITAGELRASGITVPADIPDCGWIRRASIRLSCPGIAPPTELERRERRLPEVKIDVTFTEPFQWVNFAGGIEP